MGKIDDSIIGKRFDRLTVLEFSHVDARHNSYWLCACDCGNKKVISSSNLKSGITTSCGCKSREIKDLTGQRFGRLIVLKIDHRDRFRSYHWLCKCDCGNQTVVDGNALRSGNTTSCGCKRYERRSDDITGKRFGRLTVLGFDHMGDRGKSYWTCVCDCGVETIVERSHLLNGNTTSCGCAQRDSVTTHGMTNTSLYGTWRSMKHRCNSSAHMHYDRYGGRDITVCDEWKNFEAFKDWSLNNGYEPGLSIDRIDNDKGYSPENCRWADNYIQNNNTSRNHYITYNGITHTMSEWARIFDINYSTFRNHVYNNDMRDFKEYFHEG